MEKKKWLAAFRRRIARLLTVRNQCILFVLTIGIVAAAVYAAATDAFPELVNVTLYALAAFGFVCTCTLWVKAILFFVKAVWLPFTKNNQVASTLLADTRLRTVLITVPGMGLNFIYALFNGVIGFMGHSAWYGSLAAYYILLCLMRFLAVSYGGKIYRSRVPWKKNYTAIKNAEWTQDSQEIRSWKVYKSCGVMFSFMSVALGGAVILLVTGEGGKSYPGLMIYTVATYTFYKMVMAVRNRIKAGKEKSTLLVTLRNISYADALVSMLSLQTALFAAFGQDSGDLVPTMNALTGAGVCLMILAMGLYMIHKSRSRIICMKRRGKNDTYSCGG